MPGRPDPGGCATGRPPSALLAVLAVLAAALLGGCGGSSGTTAAESPSPPPGQGYRGAKGEQIEGEAATGQHLSGADCAALRRLAEAQVGHPLQLESKPAPPSSSCRLTAGGIAIGVYLDSGRSAHQRYLNRMVEQDQFGAPDPGRVTHPVPHVGEPAPGNQNASWVPNLGSLFATRGNRWLTVTYAADGVPGAQARARAAALARLGFRLTSH
ncbi:MAG: hypothetical protein JST31_06545 [Actinobacteria bacterium]|nr:hypothetical protein [Actinomycetota bacterium]